MSFVKDLRYVLSSVRSAIMTRPSTVSGREKFRRMQQAAFKRARSLFNMSYHQGAEVSALRGDWASTVTAASTIVRTDFSALCARSEMAYRTDVWVRRAIQVLASFVVGQGLRPFPAVRDDNGEIAEPIVKKLADDFERFNDQGIRNGPVPITYYEAQALTLKTMAVYGNVLTNTVKSQKGSWLPFALQLVKPTRLDFSKDTYYDDYYTIGSRPKIVHGIEINDFGEPVRFWLQGINDPYPSSQMVLSFYPLETESYLGLPWTAPALGNVWDNQQIFEDKLKQSRILSKMGVRILPKDKGSFNAAVDGASEETGDEFIDLDFQGLVAADEKSLQPLKLDDSMKESFLPLVRLNLMAFAAGMGFSYQTMASDLEGMNFAASRANIINDNRYFRGIFRFLTKVVEGGRYNKFVEWEILSGKLAGLVSYSDYIKDPWRFNQAYWLPLDGEDWVDPLKDAEALKLLYNLGPKTFQELCAMDGKDYRSVLKQKALEKKLMVEMDLKELLPSAETKPTNQQAYANQEK